jgi:2-amino-4-hydroxy-6-hydroxymethyldihydropteridine diphosphokinase
VKTRAVIALGSNLGSREENLLMAIAAIKEFPKTSLTAVSTFHETDAVTEIGVDLSRPSYLNAVVIVSTELTIGELFESCQAIEKHMGRVREFRFQDRNIDIDLIAFGSVTHQSEDLIVPHPRAHERLFVLAPWHEVDEAADIVGVGKVSELISRLVR